MIAEALFSLAVATARCENATFDFPTTYDAGAQPKTAAAVDFDGDGLLDLAVGGPSGVVLLRGDGRGGFSPRRTLTTAPVTELFTLGHDLYAFDSATVTNLSNGTTITGSGHMVYGHFNGERVLFVDENVRAVGDIDGDGNDDLVLLNGSTLTFLRWNGTSFVSAGTAQISTPDPGTIVVADFDGDGHNDVGIRSSTIPLLEVYRGHGGFRLDAPLSTHYERGAFHIADVTGDGKPDVIGEGTHFASLYRGRGDGTFEAERPADRILAQQGVLAVADFNNDGVPDVVALNAGGVSIARGSHYAPMYTVLSVADFNKDGRPDLLGSDGATTYVALAQADGTFKIVAPPDPRNPIASIDRPELAAVADVNGDGNLDLLLAIPGGVVRFYGNGDGTFRPPKTFPLPVDPLSITAARVTASGNVDLIFYNSGDTPAFTIAFGDVDGNYTNTQSLLQKIDPSDRGFVADIDGDGRPDLVVAGIFGVAIALNGPAGFTLLPHFVGEQQVAGFIAVTDIDGDRRADLLYDDYHQLALRFGFGDGTFTAPIYLGAQSGPYSVIDVNGDGLRDIVAGSTVILNSGAFLFAAPQSWPVVDQWTAVGIDFIGTDGLLLRTVCPAPPQQQRRRTARH